jgi:hypothetical protein
VRHTLKRHCYPKLYYNVLEDAGELAVVELGWGFRSFSGPCTFSWHGASSPADAKLQGATISSACTSGATRVFAAHGVRKGDAIIVLRRKRNNSGFS